MDGFNLPSVTTILAATKSEEDKAAIAAWKERVGHREAERIKNEASSRGNSMHSYIEQFLLGKMYALTKDFQNSEQHLLMAIKIKDQPMDAEYFSLALTYKYLEAYKKAFDWFQKTLKENPDHTRALYERAVAADNYFKDVDTRINYYQAFWDKYYGEDSNYLAKDMLYLTKNRISDLKEKKHMAKDKLDKANSKDSLAEVENDSTNLANQKK
mgnify:CR=1 FL=1